MIHPSIEQTHQLSHQSVFQMPFSIRTSDISHVRADSAFQLSNPNEQKMGMCGTCLIDIFQRRMQITVALETVNPHRQLQDDVRHEFEHTSTNVCQH